jgi:hypothetical protein
MHLCVTKDSITLGIFPLAVGRVPFWIRSDYGAEPGYKEA